MLGWLLDEIFKNRTDGYPGWVLLILLGICVVIGVPLGIAFGSSAVLGFLSFFHTVPSF